MIIWWGNALLWKMCAGARICEFGMQRVSILLAPKSMFKSMGEQFMAHNYGLAYNIPRELYLVHMRGRGATCAVSNTK